MKLINEEIEDILKEAEQKLVGLRSIKKAEAAAKRNSVAYELRANTILDSMSEHLQKLRELMEDLDKD